MTYEIEMEERVFTDIWLVILEVWIGDTNSAKSFIKNAYLLLLHALVEHFIVKDVLIFSL